MISRVLLPGAIAGLVMAAAFLLFERTVSTYALREIAGLLVMLCALAVAQVFALREMPRDLRATFMPRYFAAMFSGAAAAIVYGTFCWLYFALWNPAYLDVFYADYLKRAGDAGGADAVAAAERMRDFVTDPFAQAATQAGTVLMLGLLAGAVVAALGRPRTGIS